MDKSNSKLSLLYAQVDKKLKSLKLNQGRLCAYLFPFALFDEHSVCLMVDGEPTIRDKTLYGSQFVANTAIPWEGGYMATWFVAEDIDLDRLSSKMLHEMYHAHQNSVDDRRFADEQGAIFECRADAKYLSIKARENALIVQLTSICDADAMRQLAALRRTRRALYPYESEYEAKVETIEGMAQYVEMMALLQLNPMLYNESITKMKKRVLSQTEMLPIRIPCYDTGTLLLLAMAQNGIDVGRCAASCLTISEVLTGEGEETIAVETDERFVELVKNDELEQRARIDAIKDAKPLVQGEGLKLLGVNIYSARFLNGYIYSEYFVMFEDKGEEKLLEGNYLIKMADRERIEAIYSA
ncbi:MAG: hypothetical protein PHT58_07555 [Eubacteriales bacterium]|nr:hypothetical protein [Eubacteriales bacterium]